MKPDPLMVRSWVTWKCNQIASQIKIHERLVSCLRDALAELRGMDNQEAESLFKWQTEEDLKPFTEDQERWKTAIEDMFIEAEIGRVNGVNLPEAK